MHQTNLSAVADPSPRAQRHPRIVRRRSIVACRPHGAGVVRESHAPIVSVSRTDDTLPDAAISLAPAVRRLFNIRGHYAPNAAYYRCVDGMVKVCFVGANLPCGKANTSENQPAVARWCETHPDTESIPLYVTGHDSLDSWHCDRSRKAATGAPVGTLDRRGFFEEYWKMVK